VALYIIKSKIAGKTAIEYMARMEAARDVVERKDRSKRA
jgi:hypothetical protein